MTSETYLFRGADISGRDQLLRSGASRVRSPAKTLATTVTSFAIGFTVFAAAATHSTLRAAGTSDAAIHVSDVNLERVWKAKSEGVQPNDKARHLASAVLAEMDRARIDPDRIVADPDGGIALYVFGTRESSPGAHIRHGRLLAANEGDVIALCVDYSCQMHDAWQVDVEDLASSVERIRAFVLG